MAEVIFEFLKSNDKETQSLFKLGEQVRDALDNECRDSSGWIKIFIGFRTQSGERTDNDIVIFGDLKGKFKVSSEDCLVSSFATVIECKAHSRPNGSNQNIRFVANNIEVRYPNRRTGGYYWENVSAHAASCCKLFKSERFSENIICPFI